MTTFGDVVQAWRVADPKHIHPTREHETETAYWESGRPQAELVLNLIGEGGTVLDFGCGDGRITIPMAKLGLVVTAVDASPEMIDRLRANAKRQNAPQVQTFVGDGTGFTIGTRFDAVNARAVFIHHSHDDVATMIGHLAALLRPGGYLIADWPTGGHHVRRDWIDVTTWDSGHRQQVADTAGLTLVSENGPSVWVKA